MGYLAFAEAVLTIPKVLAENSGYDIQESIILMKDEYNKNNKPMGLDLYNFEVMDPYKEGVFDNYCVKR